MAIIDLDIDGVIAARIPAQRDGIPLIGHHNPEDYKKPLSLKYNLYDEYSYDSTTISSIFQAVRHLAAPVFPDAIRVIKQLYSKDLPIYGNTGRYNTEPMRWSTETSFRIADISHCFEDIYYRPRGFSSTESKASGLHLISVYNPDEEIEVVDDNPYNLLPLSKQFPRENFQYHLINDLTTNRLLQGIDLAREYPNVTRHDTLRQALAKYL